MAETNNFNIVFHKKNFHTAKVSELKLTALCVCVCVLNTNTLVVFVATLHSV